MFYDPANPSPDLIPPYIRAAGADTPELRFKWDDWIASGAFVFKPDKIVQDLAGATLRARIVVGIGIYEWIIFRFRLVSEDPTPFQVAEAAWCGSVKQDCMIYEEFDRDEWLGPIRGPLWCAMTWLIPMIFLDDNNSDEWDSGIAYLVRLAVHVLPHPQVFLDWLNETTRRMLALFPVVIESPFEDLFGENQEARRGPLIPREVLIPDFLFEPDMTEGLINRFLTSLDHRRNPYLTPPE
jgi:hypothetical protein